MEKKKKFQLFNFNRDGKGVDPGEDTTPNLGYFFKLVGRKFSNLLTLNLMILIPMVLPIGLAIYIFFNGPQMPTLSSPAFSALMGANLAGGGAELLTKLITGIPQLNFITYNSYASWLPYVLLGLLAVTWGWQNTGITYILRGYVRGDGIFIFSDYFYAIKKNFKQGFILGLIDAIIIVVLGVDFMYMWSALSAASYWSYLMFFVVIALIILYLFMRMYMYLMMITFNISLYKMFKNALIFTALGIKRNLMTGLGLVICLVLWAALAIVGIQTSFGVIMFVPALIMFAFMSFMCAYCAYPVIKKHMIDPVAVPNGVSEKPAPEVDDQHPDYE